MDNPFRDGWTMAEMDDAVRRNNPDELLYVPLWVSMDPPDCHWAQAICLRLAGHHHPGVRGNAILGFGHLARTCGDLPEALIKPLVEAARHDPEPFVRNQAEAAMDDLRQFMGWTFAD